MSGDDQNFTVWGFIKGFGKLIIGLLLLLQGLIGLVVLVFFVSIYISFSNNLAGGAGATNVSIQPDSALLFNPNGVLVEQAEIRDPFNQIVEEAYGLLSQPGQIELGEAVRALRKAKDDARIKALVLDLTHLETPNSSASKLHALAAEIDAFKASGKKVIAIGDHYTQEQYFLAAHADEIYMNNFGQVLIYGYGSYGTYIKSLLEKLKITAHIFRVGTFKSAVEPFIRDDMSPEAKQANLAYLSVMWDEFVRSTEIARSLPTGSIQRYADEFDVILDAAGGDMAKAALDYGLVDGLKSRSDQLAYLKEQFGADSAGASFKHVSFNRYRLAIGQNADGAAPNIAVVTVAGTIVDGEAIPGEGAGGDTISRYLKKAREDKNVKAVVLRVDSPGGSAFASEVIRDQVLALKQADKPVVVSMGSLAASGGYWVSAAGDEIWAAPTTITGSIGIFGYLATFENTAAEAGVYSDGVGTTDLSPILASGIGPLPDSYANLIQRSVEEGYERFLNIVSDGRNLDAAYVDSIGQGRVWIGAQALDLKLVDKIGGLDEAIAAAAARANLEDYDVIDMIERPTPFERFFGAASAQVMKLAGVKTPTARGHISTLQKLFAEADATAQFLVSFNDPGGLYARCLACEAR